MDPKLCSVGYVEEVLTFWLVSLGYVPRPVVRTRLAAELDKPRQPRESVKPFSLFKKEKLVNLRNECLYVLDTPFGLCDTISRPSR